MRSRNSSSVIFRDSLKRRAVAVVESATVWLANFPLEVRLGKAPTFGSTGSGNTKTWQRKLPVDIMFFLKVMIVLWLFVIICVHCLVRRRQREHNVWSVMFAIIAIKPSKGKFQDELNTPASLSHEFEYFTNQRTGWEDL